MEKHDPWAIRTHEWLSRLGYEVEPEPAWILKGKRPDFYCTGPEQSFWCEVKSIGPTSAEEQRFRLHDYFRRNSSKVQAQGFAIALVSADADERDAKAALALVEPALEMARQAECGRSIVIVPENPGYGSRVSFLASNAETNVLFLCCRAVDGRYGYPLTFQPDPWVQTVEVASDEGVRSTRLHEIASEDAFRISLDLHPDVRPFHIAATGSAGGASRLRTAERIRKQIGDANRQFKNALRYHIAPTVVVIHHHEIITPDDRILMAALLGDLTYVFSSGNFQDGHLVYARNAAWRPGQNTSTSAACFMRDAAEPLTLHNPLAERRLRIGTFGDRDILVENDGTLHEVSPGES